MGKRIGIYSGVFDPVHDGHINFAVMAINKANLDKVYILPERLHRTKVGVSHYAHRLAMLKLAIEPYKKLSVLDFPDKQFSVSKTQPRLNQKFPKDELFFLVGSDLLENIPTWPLVDRLFKRVNLIVGLRNATTQKKAEQLISHFPSQPQEIIIFESPDVNLSSSQIRETSLAGQEPKGLNPEVLKYIKSNWLYVSPSNSNSAS